MTVIDMLSRQRRPAAHSGFEAAAVANAIIDLSASSGDRLTHLRLQKLLYIANAWHMLRHGRPLIAERPRAWPHGAIFESVYVAITQIASNQLISGQMICSRFDRSTPRLPIRHPDVQIREAVEEALITVKTVWTGMRTRTDEQLRSMLHLSGGGWHMAMQQRLDAIPDEFMVEEAKTWSYEARAHRV